MRTRALIAVIAVVATFSAVPAAVAAGPERQRPTDSYIVVDHDTGDVLASHNARTPLPPASITKLLTALVVATHTEPSQMIAIGGHTAQAMPALKIDLRQGEQWRVEDLMRALLMVSANDAGVALAEHVSGDLESFSAERYRAARELGLADGPWLNDPSGLDDEFSHRGGDLVSARDMAIIGRAALATPEIAGLVDDRRYDFVGPDGRSRYMLNHNGLLKTYPGAVGMKTGYTRKAKQTVVAAARRDGRTMLVVVMGVDQARPLAASLLDQGFATPPGSRPTGDRLELKTLGPPSQPALTTLASGDASAHAGAGGGSLGWRVLVLAAIGSLIWRLQRRSVNPVAAS